MKHLAKYFIIALIAFPLSAKAQQTEEMQYRRSSIYSLLINHTDQKFSKEIADVFKKMPTP